MNKYIAILLLACSGAAFADSYLCIAESAAGIRLSSAREDRSTKASIYKTSERRWILTNIKEDYINPEGKWVVKTFGIEYPRFLNCTDEPLAVKCVEPRSNEFFNFHKVPSDYVAFTEDFGTEAGVLDSVIERGRCSKI